LSYVLEAAMTVVQHLSFRNLILKLLVKLYRALPTPDYISISKCLVHLNEPLEAAQMLAELIKGGDVMFD
jgi:26S proteasome regulatory subunit N2